MSFVRDVYLAQLALAVLLVGTGTYMWHRRHASGAAGAWARRQADRLVLVLFVALAVVQGGGWLLLSQSARNHARFGEQLFHGFLEAASLSMEVASDSACGRSGELERRLGSFVAEDPHLAGLTLVRRRVDGSWRVVFSAGRAPDPAPARLLLERVGGDSGLERRLAAGMGGPPFPASRKGFLQVLHPVARSGRGAEGMLIADLDEGSFRSGVRIALLEALAALWFVQFVVVLLAARAWLLRRIAEHDHGERERLAEAAYRDGLTSLHNRRWLEEQFLRLQAKDPQARLPRCLLVFDVDHFKDINDTWGHSGGDEVLVGLADLLRAQLRGRDLLARWGGDEFVALLLETSETEAAKVVELLRHRVETGIFPPTRGVTCSFGLTRVKPGEPLAVAMQRADRALYQAKESGRNGVSSVFPED